MFGLCGLDGLRIESHNPHKGWPADLQGLDRSTCQMIPPKAGNSSHLPRGLWEPVCDATKKPNRPGSQGKISGVVNGLWIRTVYGLFGLNPFFTLAALRISFTIAHTLMSPVYIYILIDINRYIRLYLTWCMSACRLNKTITRDGGLHCRDGFQPSSGIFCFGCGLFIGSDVFALASFS